MAARLTVRAELAQLSVVVPIGPGDAIAPALREQLAALPAAAELRMVCSNGADAARMRAAPTPETSDFNRGPRWQCTIASPGRAAQQNAGADAATRPWLWFLHADSRLAPSTLPALADFLRRDVPALGYFDLRFLDDGPALMRLNALGAWMRSRWLGMPFGDQGLLLPRVMFHALGRFDTALARGEDHELVWRARHAGLPLRPLHAPLYTSARRYAEHGWARVTARTLHDSWRQARHFARRRAGQ